jgi:hypothetical protein
MRLIEDIRNRGFKGFDHLPHYDLTDLSITLNAFATSTVEAYSRPIHEVFTCEIRQNWGGIIILTARDDDLILFNDAGEEEETTTAQYEQLVFCKQNNQWDVGMPDSLVVYNDCWVPKHAAPSNDVSEIEKRCVGIYKRFPFLSGWFDDAKMAKRGSGICLGSYNSVRIFLALCHTKGVEVETHTPTPKQGRGFRRKNRKIPRSFKTLKLPQNIQSAVSESESEETGNKLDQPHFRRGHLKTAKSPRYKVKNWWTESHIVGKDATGKLITDTRVIK